MAFSLVGLTQRRDIGQWVAVGGGMAKKGSFLLIGFWGPSWTPPEIPPILGVSNLALLDRGSYPETGYGVPSGHWAE